ncbi:MAG: rhodanese-like domain-containing protein [bacterium]|nr:rhodanese-like domain-containing protein [bacterium]
MAKTVTTEELKGKIDNKETFILVDTLGENSYEMRHIPGAVNIPNGPNFLEQFEEKAGAQKDQEIITYCSSSTCHASVEAAAALEESGYTKVGHYADGIAGWQQAGYSFEEGK